MILGIDISTSRIGYSIIDYTTKLILCQEIKLKSSDTLEDRCKIFENKMKEIEIQKN